MLYHTIGHNRTMPRQNVNYQKTLIYKLVCNDLEVKEIYVGQTTNFRNRKDTHKRACRNSFVQMVGGKVSQ
jgi:predicted GIY-YIG superfamily endonuclease